MCKRMREIKAEVKEGIDLGGTEIVTKDPYTYVETRARVNEHVYVGAGFAKRNPKDEPDMQLGVKIAIGRAIHTIAQQVFEQRFPELTIKVDDYTASKPVVDRYERLGSSRVTIGSIRI